MNKRERNRNRPIIIWCVAIFILGMIAIILNNKQKTDKDATLKRIEKNQQEIISTINQTGQLLPEIKKKISSAQDAILSDKEVYEILKEYVGGRLKHYKPSYRAHLPEHEEKVVVGAHNLLVDVLEFKNNKDIKGRLEKLKKNLDIWGEWLEDAPDWRLHSATNTRICIAEAIIYNDLKHTCGIGECSSITPADVDDILALEQVFPYFLSGFAYYIEGNYSKAGYYFNQVKLHRQIKIEKYGKSYFNFTKKDEIYDKIYQKTIDLLAPFYFKGYYLDTKEE